MKIESLAMITRNGEFVDLLLNVSFSSPISGIDPLLCITYDKLGKSVIVGFLSGADIITVPLTEALTSDINAFIHDNNLYNEVLEIVAAINNEHKQVKIS